MRVALGARETAGAATTAIFKLFTAGKAECQELNSPPRGVEPFPYK
jgi:hypothetical protein